ncbi:Dolichyl-diphosphooligosaccharide--protein glycosyltransferase subunit dad-1 [Yarrowia sp. C11]|nr:Dolichyl-diphosphooligosaccharide--protein glycosyltransferase subunit dad-1 [Yarrowia sp. E02]KAG5371959.1 Dolichyl-diphosphooligosaccharide--protein glycosyltransferase subunit dad-1 [Yarrowia sp. C11]
MAPKKSVKKSVDVSVEKPDVAEAAASVHVANSNDNVFSKVLNNYSKQSTPKLKLIDSFLAFLVVLGVFQFVFCLLVGNFPFNAFLGGFASTVGQFVLTAALRIQTAKQNAKAFPGVSSERSFADFLLGSLVLHFCVYHFIN